jgi:hypothetical protein
MSENHERFKNLAAGIQSIILSIVVIIGGIWTVITFSILGTKEKSMAELEKEKTEQYRQANIGLDINIAAKQEQLIANKRYYISALVKITNKAIRNRFIDLNQAPLEVSKVEFDENGSSILSYSLAQKNVISESIVLRTGTSIEFPFLVEVSEKGFYILTLSVKLNKEELEAHKQSGGPDKEEIYWSGDTYVLVK